MVTSTGIEQVTTYTNRPMRDGEINGKDYHFVSTEELEKPQYFGTHQKLIVAKELDKKEKKKKSHQKSIITILQLVIAQITSRNRIIKNIEP